MGMMDKVKGKISDEGHEEYEKLKAKQQSGQLNDKEKSKFEELRSHFERDDSQS